MSGCASDSGTASGGGEADSATTLEITVWPQGEGGARREWTLRCDPAGGSLPRPAKACARLTPRVLAPLPRDTICTQIYGGPQTARVQGKLDGRKVDARFRRSNGCEIHRWEVAGFLFPVKI
jgi:Subtilisin inhibitor-like